MMNGDFLVDEDFGMEMRSLDSYEEDYSQRQHQGRPERIVLTMPREWLDPKSPLPTDKEFHRWVSDQLRVRRRGGRISPSQAYRDDRSVSSNGSDSSQLSNIGRAIRETTTNLFGGVLRQRKRSVEEQMNLLEDDCFTHQRDSGVVGMELSVMS